MGKQILFNDDAKRALAEGVNKVADAVGSTMGAAGRTVIISKHGSIPPEATKDGVSVAASVILDDQVENIGAQLIRQASEKTYHDAGDGTTQTAVLAQAIINDGINVVRKGANPQEVKRGIDKAVDMVVSTLKDMSVNVGDDNDMIRGIATTSANNDKEIGGHIADAYSKIGKHGLLLIEKSDTIKTSVEVREGYEMPRGYISPEFANDPKKRAVHEKALILVADYTIRTMKEVLPLFQQIEAQQLFAQHPIIIVAQDFDGEFYSSMMINNRNGNLRCCLVKAPAAYRREHMEDIATVTGATVIRDENGLKVTSAQLNHLGSADKVIISEYTTTVIGGGGKKDKIADLKLLIQTQMDEMKDEELKKVWELRFAKIDGSVGVIKVGGATDVELREKIDRVDDACRSAKSAIDEGVVTGGGIALLKCAKYLDKIETSGDERIGVKIIQDACKMPLRKMLDNAGLEELNKNFLDRLLERIGVRTSILKNVIEKGVGFNIKTREYENLFTAGVLDPTKVIRCAMQNAASVGGAVITSDCLIVEIPAKN